MHRVIYTFLLILCTALAVSAQDTPNVVVTPVRLADDATSGVITGNIADGVQIPMRWAESSSVGLVPGTRFEQFNGNQVFYRITLPEASVINLKLIPTEGKKINLYALRQSMNPPHEVPPNVTSAISARASYPMYANTGGGQRVSNPDNGHREISLMSINDPYSILVGVSGAEGETEGQFHLMIEILPR